MDGKSARELIKEKIPSEKDISGKVKIPVLFDDINILVGMSADEALDGIITKMKDQRQVIPQYRSIREKIAGNLYGFYINYSVEQQNRVNESLATVMEEFNALTEEKKELYEKINTVRMQIVKSERAK